MINPLNESEALDCRGMRCPIPSIKTAQKLKDMEIGEELILLSDDPATKPDLAAWARMRNQFAEEIAPQRYRVRRIS